MDREDPEPSPEHVRPAQRLPEHPNVFGNRGSAVRRERAIEMTVSHDAVEPVTESTHDTSWSANLEKPHHAEDRNLVVSQARDAVDHTVPGAHVNLVTHAEHGHPETYLYEELDAAYGDDVDYEYVQQCGCGGHVTRVHVQA